MIIITDKQGNTYDLRIRPRNGVNQFAAEQSVKDMLDMVPEEMFSCPPTVELDPEKR